MGKTRRNRTLSHTVHALHQVHYPGEHFDGMVWHSKGSGIIDFRAKECRAMQKSLISEQKSAVRRN